MHQPQAYSPRTLGAHPANSLNPKAATFVKSRYLLAQNIRALIRARGTSDRALAAFCGHSGAWLSKVLKLDGDPRDHREMSMADMDKVADFFGLQVSDLLSYGIASVLERRRAERRSRQGDRRQGERRRPSDAERLYGDVPTWRTPPRVVPPSRHKTR